MRFRTFLFWLHLVAGVSAGLVIAVMCFTGTVLAFEKDIVAFAERDVARVSVPTGEPTRVSLDHLLKRSRELLPNARPASLTVFNDPGAAVAVAFGREGVVYANPYTGEIPAVVAKRTRAFMHFMTDLHRRLAFKTGAPRTVGLALTGASNIAFFVLAVTGLYLWWPRNWSWRGLKAIAIFNLRLAGKARDFNWHNAVGLWTAPVLIVLTLTAVPISYRWANNLVYTLTGNEPPAQTAGGPPVSSAPVSLSAPPTEAKPLGYDALLASVSQPYPDWHDVVFRFAQRRPAAASDDRAKPAEPITAVVRTAGQWPFFATTTLALDPFSGAIVRTEPFAEYNAGRRARTWTRYLHTGEVFGWPGKLVAGLASLLALLLVWTGFALAWRRFFPARRAV